MNARSPQIFLALVLVASATFAGCLEGDPGQVESNQLASDGNETIPAGNTTVSYDAPSVVIDVTGDDLVVNDTENGTVYEVAVGANVTFDASESTDPAEGNLSFVWDLGDGNTSEGANVTYAFGASGNQTVTVTVTSDVSEESATESIVVAVADGGATAEPATVTMEGTSTGAWAQGYYGDVNEHPFSVSGVYNKITVSISFEGTAVDLDYGVSTPDGEEVERVANYNEPTGTAYGAGEPPIVIEDPEVLAQTGEWVVTVYPGITVMGDYTITVTME